jgi:hypothetical protein
MEGEVVASKGVPHDVVSPSDSAGFPDILNPLAFVLRGEGAPLTRKEAVSKLSELTSKSNAYALLAKDGRYASHLDEREGKLHFVEKPPSGTGIPDSSSSENPGGE